MTIHTSKLKLYAKHATSTSLTAEGTMCYIELVHYATPAACRSYSSAVLRAS